MRELNIIQVDNSVLCNDQVETIDHLYFQCPFSAYLWSLCKIKLDLQPSVTTLSEEAIALQQNSDKRRNGPTWLKLHLVPLYGTLGRRGIQEFSKISKGIRYWSLEIFMKTMGC